MSDLKIAIAGAGGKMGAANIRAVTQTPGLVVHSAFDRIGSPVIGRDAGEVAGMEALGVAILDHVEAAIAGAQAIIDFTAPAASVALAKLASQRGLQVEKLRGSMRHDVKTTTRSCGRPWLTINKS